MLFTQRHQRRNSDKPRTFGPRRWLNSVRVVQHRAVAFNAVEHFAKPSGNPPPTTAGHGDGGQSCANLRSRRDSRGLEHGALVFGTLSLPQAIWGLNDSEQYCLRGGDHLPPLVCFSPSRAALASLGQVLPVAELIADRRTLGMGRGKGRYWRHVHNAVQSS